MSDQPTISVAALRERIAAILGDAGLNALQAGSLADVMASGERDGCKSHGIYRLGGILRTMEAGLVRKDAVARVVSEEGAIVKVDGMGGFANPAFQTGLAALVRATQTHGLAALVVNNCVHFSALWWEIEAVVAHDLAALAMCPSYATVAPTGGSLPLLGTNPVAFGWPRPGKPPYVFDFATSVAARGEIELHRRAGTDLPEGWAVGPDGQPTVQPEAALAGAMLPFGGHKGSAISTMVELLGAVMIGDLTSKAALERIGTTNFLPQHGELLIAFGPRRFTQDTQAMFARSEELFALIVDQGARLPSSRRFAARLKTATEGIALSPEDRAILGL